MKHYKKIFGVLTALAAFALAMPAGAFYMQAPKSLQNVRFQKTSNGVILVQDAQAPAPAPQQTCILRGIEVPGPCSNYGVEEPAAPAPQQQPMQQQQPNQGPQSGSGGCAPGTQCGSSGGQFDQQMGPGGGGQFGPGGQGQGQGQMGPQGQNWGEGQGQGEGQNEQMEQQRKAREEQDLKRMKRDMGRMGSMVTQFERMIAQVEKKGTPVSSEVKDKVAKIKSILKAVKNATGLEELQAAGVEEIQELTQSLEEFRRDVVEAQQRMDGIKRGLKGMEQGMRMFEKQVAMLSKKGVTIPSEVQDNLNKVKTMIAAIKAAKTWEEVEAAGIEDMQELFMSLDESRQKLEVLARWPQTLKQINAEFNRLNSALKRAKSMVSSLSKRGIDLSDVYANFEAAVSKLKSVRDDAAAKMQAGESEEAFNLLENDFFGQMEDVWENQRVIEMMSNLGRFAADFKRGIADSKRTIAMLKRKKIDTTELADLVAQAEAKGGEVLALMKVKPVDQEAIFAGLQELENLKQAFEEKVSELTGAEEIMPWEKGPQQFQGVSMPSTFQQYIPKKQQQEGPSEGGAGPGGPGGGGPLPGGPESGGMGPGF